MRTICSDLGASWMIGGVTSKSLLSTVEISSLPCCDHATIWVWISKGASSSLWMVNTPMLCLRSSSIRSGEMLNVPAVALPATAILITPAYNHHTHFFVNTVAFIIKSSIPIQVNQITND